MFLVQLPDFEPIYVRTSNRGLAILTVFRYLRGREVPEDIFEFWIMFPPKTRRVRKKEALESGWTVLKPEKVKIDKGG